MACFERIVAVAFEPSRLEVAVLRRSVFGPSQAKTQTIGMPRSAICPVTGAIRDQEAIDGCLMGAIARASLLVPEVLALGIPSAACFFRSESFSREAYSSAQDWLDVNLVKVLPCDPSVLTYVAVPSRSERDGYTDILIVAVKREILLGYTSLAVTRGREIALVAPVSLARKHDGREYEQACEADLSSTAQAALGLLQAVRGRRA
jgi:hypothetical protein